MNNDEHRNISILIRRCNKISILSSIIIQYYNTFLKILKKNIIYIYI